MLKYISKIWKWIFMYLCFKFSNAQSFDCQHNEKKLQSWQQWAALNAEWRSTATGVTGVCRGRCAQMFWVNHMCPLCSLNLETVPFWVSVSPWRKQKLAVQAKNEASGAKCCSSSAYHRASKRSCQLMVFWYLMATHSLHWAGAVFMHLRQT